MVSRSGLLWIRMILNFSLNSSCEKHLFSGFRRECRSCLDGGDTLLKKLIIFTFLSILPLCPICVNPVLAATESGDAALPATGAEPGGEEVPPDVDNQDNQTDESPENKGFSYATDLEEELEETIAATERLERNLKKTTKELQSLHSVDDFSNLLLRNPEWKIRLDQYENPTDEGGDDGTSAPQWEQSSEEIYQALTKRGVDPSRMEWGHIGSFFMPEK